MVTKASDIVVRAANSHAFDWNPDTTSGLEWGYFGGAWTDNKNYGVISNGTITLPDNTGTTIVIDPTNGNIGTESDVDSVNAIPIATVVTAGGEITSVTDLRTPFVKKTAIPTVGGLPVTAYTRHSYDSGVMTWIPFNETNFPSDRLLTDKGYGNQHCILVGDSSGFTFGETGPGGAGIKALRLNRSGTTIEQTAGVLLPNSSYQDINFSQKKDAGMVAIWVYFHGSLPSNDAYLWGMFGSSNTSQPKMGFIRVTSAGAVQARMGNQDTPVTFTADGAITPDAWYWVCLRKASGGAVENEIYINGVDVTDESSPSNQEWAEDLIVSEQVMIGDMTNICSHYGKDTSGVIHAYGAANSPGVDISICNYQMWWEPVVPSTDQITSLYNAGIGAE